MTKVRKTFTRSDRTVKERALQRPSVYMCARAWSWMWARTCTRVCVHACVLLKWRNIRDKKQCVSNSWMGWKGNISVQQGLCEGCCLWHPIPYSQLQREEMSLLVRSSSVPVQKGISPWVTKGNFLFVCLVWALCVCVCFCFAMRNQLPTAPESLEV